MKTLGADTQQFLEAYARAEVLTVTKVSKIFGSQAPWSVFCDVTYVYFAFCKFLVLTSDPLTVVGAHGVSVWTC